MIAFIQKTRISINTHHHIVRANAEDRDGWREGGEGGRKGEEGGKEGGRRRGREEEREGGRRAGRKDCTQGTAREYRPPNFEAACLTKIQVA
jgi:hypothetical protein